MAQGGQFWKCEATYGSGYKINANISFTVGKYEFAMTWWRPDMETLSISLAHRKWYPQLKEWTIPPLKVPEMWSLVLH